MSDAATVAESSDQWLVDASNDPYDASITVTITVKLVGDKVDYHIQARNIDGLSLVELLCDAAEIVAEEVGYDADDD